ncbi:MAG: bifunctional diaminohydroxyphosphoribosylaminopyrimidine deaminase/5-amino-6-(5-phosphoribosylamino)uracil reductase RibD [Bacteroidota bacterium]|nr:bifunctional diaminohydroxyphosphoribosylaminopyrimidine deaminase/5-amino-6-(5-phosphoribosylamino)uracil reductase RibD [Bacteroidota bacterium]
MNRDNKYMKRCLELAKLGKGNTYPNPMVGSVIVYQDTIIGEGYHKIYGEAHAEVNAINSVKNKELLKHSTIYVNLEPCSHYGKTPPCANLIASKKIPNVVIGNIDISSKVSGKGIEILKNASCNVTTGILEKECKDLNKRFFTFQEKKRPYIILKWAQSSDGFIDKKRKPNDGKIPVWLTNDYARTIVHKWRAEEQSILVGTNTAILDNPNLNIRNWRGKNPLRIVFDKNLILSQKLNIFNNEAQTLIIADNSVKNKTIQIQNKNIGIEFADFQKDITYQLLNILYRKNIHSVIVEGGAKTLSNFIKNNIWDEARIFISIKELKNGVKAPTIKTDKAIKQLQLANNKLIIVKNNN